MGTYSIFVGDSHILEKVSGMKSVCIFGCPHCTNESIAYAKDMLIIGKRRSIDRKLKQVFGCHKLGLEVVEMNRSIGTL